MPDKAEALGILLVLLPGFASAYIVQMLAVRRKQSELDKIVEALLFSLVFYLITLPLFGNTLPLSWRALDAKHPDVFEVVVQWKHLATLAGLALVLGIVYASNINYDLLARLLFKIGIRIRGSRVNIWNDALEELEGFVQVGLPGGRRVIGWVRDFSDEEDVYELFLESAAWVDKDGHQQPIDGPGILLTKESGIEYVTFLHEGEEHENEETGNEPPAP
jgi:hypothetical protein